MIVTVYTDGSCKGTPGPGGYGALVEWGGHHTDYLAGGHPETTNNRMELLGAIRALTYIADFVRDADDASSLEVIVTVDSEYVRKGITEWIKNWKRNGWKTSGRKPVINQDLWMIFDAVVENHPFSKLRWAWVKGHSGHPGNETADQLADYGARNSTSRGEFHEISSTMMT